MTLKFGPYTVEREPLNNTELEEIGVSRKFLDTYLIPFLQFIVRFNITGPVKGIDIAKDREWKPDLAEWRSDGNIKKLRRAAWYLFIPVGSVCGAEDDKDGYYWPRSAAEFQPTIDQYDGRFFALARTRTHLETCKAMADLMNGINVDLGPLFAKGAQN